MTSDVLVRITNIQESTDAPGVKQEPIAIVTPGRFFTDRDNKYVRYEEILDDEGLSTVNTAKITGDVFEIRKHGAVNVHMLFQEGRKNLSFYETPFGKIEMGIITTGYGLKETPEKITVDLRYTLEMNGEPTADNELTLEVMAKGSDFKL